MSRLVDWFAPSSTMATQNSYIGRPEGWFRIHRTGHIIPHTFKAAMVQVQVLERRTAEREVRRAKREKRRAQRARARVKGKGKAREVSSSSSSDDGGSEDEDSESEWYAPEPLRSPNSIAKHALQRSGTRDMAVLVFVALVRALGIPARLVASLQCVSWSVPKDYSKKTRPKKGASTATRVRSDQISAEDDVEMEEVLVPMASTSRIGTPGSAGGRVNFSTGTSPSRQHTDHNSDSSVSLQVGTKRKRTTLPEKATDDPRGRSIRDISKGSSTTRLAKQPVDEGKGRRDRVEDSDNGTNSAHTIELRRARPVGNVLGAAPATPWGPTATGGGASSIDGMCSFCKLWSPKVQTNVGCDAAACCSESVVILGSLRFRSVGVTFTPVAIAEIRLDVGPPTLWAEVFSRPDGRWMPVDPVRGIVNRASVFEERDKAGRKKSNKLVYVVAIEEGKFIFPCICPERDRLVCV